MGGLNDKFFNALNDPVNPAATGTWLAVSSNAPLAVTSATTITSATVNQGTSPWTVSGNSASVIVQGTSPWVVSSNTTAPTTISSNSPLAVTAGQGTNPWTVSTNSAQVVVQGTSPWTISANSALAVIGTFTNTGSATQTSNTSGIFPVTVSQIASANFNIASSANTQIVGGTVGQAINIYGLILYVSGSAGVNQVTHIDASGNTLLPAMTFTSNSGMVFDLRPDPWMTCAQGASYNLLTSTALNTTGKVYYRST